MASGGQRPNSGPDTKHYDTAEKRECRETLTKHAVECLTTARKTSTCVQRHQVREAWDKFEKSGEAKRSFNDEEVIQIKDEIREWELFHDSQTKEKKPSDLRVCYIAGENPLNELNVFIKNGILSQNICVIVKNSEAIENVWEVAMDSRSARKVQLFKGTFLECMKETEGQFDIISFDSTDSLPSQEHVILNAIGHVFLYNKLASPGALITTFSVPPEDTKENYSDYIFYQVIDTPNVYIPTLRRLISLSSQNNNPFGEQSIERKECSTEKVKNLNPSSEPPQKSHENASFKAWQNLPHGLDTSTDVVLPRHWTQMVSFLLAGQIHHPSYIVPEKLLRLKREGQMFSDVFIFDNCRYVFQQFPSVNYEHSEVFQSKRFWVVQTIAERLANKLGFIYRDDFDYCQSTTSDEPIEIRKRKAIILTKGLKYSKSMINFDEYLKEHTEKMNKCTPNRLRIGPRKLPFSRQDSLRKSCPERGRQHRLRWSGKESGPITLETFDPIDLIGFNIIQIIQG
ncbi:uncharacterized protein LOC110241761 [Exaiptasia diaphana]|uniref:Uncharacterized protein n=1 Tax=Exaiptasia diaphana TaxID=2652724 RepID=A0A913YJW6_EXADI|nr:uncharacterized protein LOC110241761 [Exaiptasia diaphana]XP_028515690.1 uncharacterized protein LOC110241761 [Exaiptasia diaphana]